MRPENPDSGQHEEGKSALDLRIAGVRTGRPWRWPVVRPRTWMWCALLIAFLTLSARDYIENHRPPAPSPVAINIDPAIEIDARSGSGGTPVNVELIVDELRGINATLIAMHRGDDINVNQTGSDLKTINQNLAAIYATLLVLNNESKPKTINGNLVKINATLEKLDLDRKFKTVNGNLTNINDTLKELDFDTHLELSVDSGNQGPNSDGPAIQFASLRPGLEKGFRYYCKGLECNLKIEELDLKLEFHYESEKETITLTTGPYSGADPKKKCTTTIRLGATLKFPQGRYCAWIKFNYDGTRSRHVIDIGRKIGVKCESACSIDP